MEETAVVDARLLPRLAAPWLVIPYEDEEGNKENQALYNICDNKRSRKSIPELSGSNVIYQKPSHQGWLVIRCDVKDDEPNYGVCFLWNPTSLQTIQLPNLDKFLDETFDYTLVGNYSEVCDCVLSSPPLRYGSNDLDNDAMVYFLVWGLVDLIVYCHVGDKEWSKLEVPEGMIVRDEINVLDSLIFFKGTLYIMCCDDNHQLVVEKLPPPSGDDGRISLGIRRLEVSISNTEVPRIGGYSCVCNDYFLESYEEIYRIQIMCMKGCNYSPAISIMVFKLDFSEMSWKEVNSLGDTMLFRGLNTNACCSAVELGLSKGYIYYTLPSDQNLYMFDIEDKCTMTILPCSYLPTSRFSLQWIMMPLPTSSVGDGERIYKSSRFTIRGEVRPWAVDLVDSIASHLPPVDFLNFRAVCKAFKVPISKQVFGAIRSTYFWLLFSTEKGTIYNFIDPMRNNEKYLMSIPESLVGAVIRCQKSGWLILSKGITLFFYNPFTKETIQLPELPDEYFFAGISFSSLPTCRDCVVFGITQNNEAEISIYITKRGVDHWETHFQNNLKTFMTTINKPVFHKGAFYCVDFNQTLAVFNVDSGRWEVLERPNRCYKAAHASFLVECENKLLLVQMHGVSVTILELDSSKMVWQRVESLGKHMVFINPTSCLSAVAPKTCMENKVYFPRLHDKQILYYSLEKGSYHAVGSTHSSKDYSDTKSWSNSTWIEPNWSQSTSQELDWLNNNPV